MPDSRETACFRHLLLRCSKLFTTFRTFRSEGFGANVLFQVTDRKTFRLSDFPISSPDFRDSVGLSWGPTMFVKDLLSRVDRCDLRWRTASRPIPLRAGREKVPCLLSHRNPPGTRRIKDRAMNFERGHL